MRLRKYEIEMLAEEIQQAFFNRNDAVRSTKEYTQFQVDTVIPNFSHFKGLINTYTSNLTKSVSEYDELISKTVPDPSLELNWMESLIKDKEFEIDWVPPVDKIKQWLLVYISLNDDVEEGTSGSEIIELALESYELN